MFDSKKVEAYLPLVARILMGGLFVFAGVSKLMNGVPNVAMLIGSMGLPMPIVLAWATVAIEILGGAAIILGVYFKKASALLIGFTILATAVFHMNVQDINLFKNAAIIGGLLYMIVYGPGAFALKTALNRRAEKEEVMETAQMQM